MGASIYRGRYAARLSGDFVVFLIGMRINKPLKVKQWFPVFTAMPKMLRWLEQHPEAGLLHWQFALMGPTRPTIIQYWRSFEDLDRFARAPAEPHLPAWKLFNQAIRASGDVGIWHETYKVAAGNDAAIYGTMPRVGLAAAGAHVPVGSAGQSAARRIGATEVDEPALAPYPNP